MSTCIQESPPRSFELPEAFEDLTGIIATELREFQRRLWNDLTQILIETLEPLDVERH
jgi:hypothetical protein